MKYITDYKLENFILGIKWEELPEEVKVRLKGCFIDLMGALISGSRSSQFETGLRLAQRLYGEGNIPVIGSEKKFNFMGASAAMGHSSNAYDIDDGHNLTRTHPGTSFVGAILASAYENDITVKEFLMAMLVAYETSIRSGAAMMEYYDYAHSSGTFGAVGVAAGVARILGFTKEELNNVLSIADFNAPLVPGIRSVEYPSMNKDGVPFGVMIGTLAIMESLSGFEGNKNLLEGEDYKHYLDDLGENYEVMNLYFKPYPCCRWGHPAIDACVSTMKENGIKAEDVEKVVMKTFNRATRLSKIHPQTPDEAQYNIAYPVATAIVYGTFGIQHVWQENLADPKVLEMMSKLSFETDEKLDAQFPAKRICRAEITDKNGNLYASKEFEPSGEAHENIGLDWLSEKFYRITAPLITKEGQDKVLELITGDENLSVREFVDTVNDRKYWK